jgi:hypothetical protein
MMSRTLSIRLAIANDTNEIWSIFPGNARQPTARAPWSAK